MSWDEVKDEKEGYVRVRKSDDRALIGRLKKANDDPEAKGYIELNKDDLGGMGGGGGPHSHSEYASKTHAHDDKADKDHTHDLTHTHDGFATTTHTHPPQDLTHDHAGEYQPVGNYADADHTHDSEGGGESYDDSWIQPALDGKSDTTHIHDAVPAHQHPHDHNADYAGIGHTHTDVPGHNHSDYANTIHGHDEFMVLQNQINDKAAEDHVHDDAVTRFDPTYLEEKDAEEDARIEALEESQKEQNDRLDALEAGEMDAVAGIWKRNDNAAVSGGMIGIANFNQTSSIFLSRNDITHQPFDFSKIEVGTTLTVTNTNNTDAKGKYKITSMEDKGGYWNFRVDIIEGTGIASMNDLVEFSFAVPVDEEEASEHEHEGMVTSSSVTSIVRLSQAEYDALVDKDASTLYLVV